MHEFHATPILQEGAISIPARVLNLKPYSFEKRASRGEP